MSASTTSWRPSCSSASFRSSSTTSRRSASASALRATGCSPRPASADPRQSASAARRSVGGRRCPALGEHAGTACQESLEPVDIELVLFGDDPIAVAVRLDPLGPERASKAVDVDLERGCGRLRCILAPQCVDEMRAAEHLSAVKEQLCQ